MFREATVSNRGGGGRRGRDRGRWKVGEGEIERSERKEGEQKVNGERIMTGRVNREREIS